MSCLKKYTVVSGELNKVVMATDPVEAFKKAIKSHTGDLGLLGSIKQEGKEEVYCLTERICRELGMWGEGKYE